MRGLHPLKTAQAYLRGPRFLSSTRSALSIRTLARGGCRCPRGLTPPVGNRWGQERRAEDTPTNRLDHHKGTVPIEEDGEVVPIQEEDGEVP